MNNFWNTDSNGGSGTFQIGTTALNDLHFSAGTNATAGIVGLWGPFPMAANSLSFEENVAVSLYGSNNASGITLGAGNGGITVAGSVVAATTVAVPLLLNASSTITNSGSGLLTVSGPIALASNAALTITGPGSTTIAGVISGGSQFGTTGLTITGGATVNLLAANTFRGDIAVSGAGSTLIYDGGTTTTASRLGLSTGTGYKQILLNNGGTFRVNLTDFNDNLPTTTNLGAGVVFNVGTGGGTMEVSLGRLLTIDDGFVSNTPFTTAAAQLQGSGTLTKTGTGTLSLGNGTSNYSGFTGAIVVAGGVLQTGAVSASPFGANTAGITVQSGASLNLAGIAIGAKPLNLIGSGFAGRGALYSSAANSSVSGAITLAGDTTIGALGAGSVTLSGVVGGNANVTKVGAGAIGFNQINTVVGNVLVTEGSVNVNGAAGRLGNITGLTVVGSGTLNIGDGTAANGLANRINTALALNLGDSTGGGNVVMQRGSTVANNQSFTAVNLGGGLSTITAAGTANGAPVLTFSGANPYTRAGGGVVNITTTNQTTTFTNAPSGAGNVTGGATPILIGGVLNGDNFIAVASGSVAAPTYTTDTWGTGINTQVLNTTAPAADTVTQALAFGTGGANTVTLSGTNTIESGGIIVQAAATSGALTGGNLQAAAGKDLWIFANTKPLAIASSIVDNSGSSLSISGTGVVTSRDQTLILAARS